MKKINIPDYGEQVEPVGLLAGEWVLCLRELKLLSVTLLDKIECSQNGFGNICRGIKFTYFVGITILNSHILWLMLLLMCMFYRYHNC